MVDRLVAGRVDAAASSSRSRPRCGPAPADGRPRPRPPRGPRARTASGPTASTARTATGPSATRRPNLFSFNSPLGACPECHGFGRTVGIDWDLVVPAPSRIAARAARSSRSRPPPPPRPRPRCSRGPRRRGIPLDVPWADLSEATAARKSSAATATGRASTATSAGSRRKTYKVHVRVFLSRFRGYPPCPAVPAGRLAEEGRAWRVGGRTLPEVARCRSTDARAFFDGPRPRGDGARRARPPARPTGAPRARSAGRLEVLDASGLSYLTLDRQARTLSGGEAQRVHLTTAIGSPPRRRALRPRRALRRPPPPRQRAPRPHPARAARRREHGRRRRARPRDRPRGRPPDRHGARRRRARRARRRRRVRPAEVARDPASLTGAYLSGRRRVPRPAAPPRPSRAARGSASAAPARTTSRASTSSSRSAR